jgi:hypothetical protein
MSKNNNKWFKHYNTSHEGQTIAQLWGEKGGGEVVGFYWTILELVSRFEDPLERGKWSGNLSIFKTKLGMNRQRSRKLLEKICETFETKIFWKSSESFELFVPKWLELQETRGGKREPKKDQRPDRYKNKEVRDKNIPPNPQRGGGVSEWLVELWNQHASGVGLPMVKALGPKRKKLLLKAIADQPSQDYWNEVFEKLGASDFHCGRTGGNWVANLDWILKPDNQAKILELAQIKKTSTEMPRTVEL